MKLKEHAEAWWQQQGNVVPPRDTELWWEMYAQWVDYAFPPQWSEISEEDADVSPPLVQ